MGQERYLMGATLVWKPYREWSPTWQHDHCAFCTTKFMDRDDVPGALREGYAVQAAGPQGEDDYHWVCATCAHDFRDRFEWRLVGAPDDPSRST